MGEPAMAYETETLQIVAIVTDAIKGGWPAILADTAPLENARAEPMARIILDALDKADFDICLRSNRRRAARFASGVDFDPHDPTKD